MQKQIFGSWIHDFDKTLLSNCNTMALYESIDGPAGQLADNPQNSDGLGDFHRTLY